MTSPKIDNSAAKFDRIRRAHQSEVAEDYVEMIAELIEETGEARTVDLAARFGVTSPTVNAILQRLQREDLVETLNTFDEVIQLFGAGATSWDNTHNAALGFLRMKLVIFRLLLGRRFGLEFGFPFGIFHTVNNRA